MIYSPFISCALIKHFYYCGFSYCTLLGNDEACKFVIYADLYKD